MIVTTASTGGNGQQGLENVLGSGECVRIITRDPSRISSEVRERVEVVQGSHSNPEVVNQAFRDADNVLRLVPPDPRAESVEAAYVDFTRPACEASRERSPPL